MQINFTSEDDKSAVSGKHNVAKLPPPVQEDSTIQIQSFMVHSVGLFNVKANHFP
jgi:hypothetical protein